MATAARNKKAKLLEQLHARHAYVTGSIELIREFDDNFDVSKAAEVPFRIERLDKLMEELERIETELDSLRTGDPTFSETCAEYQTLYFRLKGSLSSKNITVPHPHPPATVSEATSASFASVVRLPELKIPEFDGNPANWAGFHDLFLAIIHDHATLSNIQKLHYLRASLKCDAARIICTLPTDATSYPFAWSMICERYEDKVMLIKQHISALFSTTPVRKESAEELLDLADEFEKHVKILDSLETKAQHWDSVLVELLFSRMDNHTQRLWENQRDKTKRPTYEDLLKFVHEHSRTLQSLKLSQTAISFTEAKPPKARPLVSNSTTEQTLKCAVCTQNHYLFQCELFRARSPAQRLDLVRRANLCINCLKASHLAKNCNSGCCKYCQKKHL
ncbi:uncharacterized protein LOC129716955 [Wyeomyia smithii]|uniref:uncharacterized protein LOC129716955 n=1 Tax=Wyeomyia smithii TaxID=174621 RepID=UPI002467DE16|nr:uncharacterized protein LOC129716955 [Wyeomyia smithii]